MKKILIIIMSLALTACASQQNLKEENFNEKANELLLNEINKIKEKQKDYEEVSLNLIEIEKEEEIKDVDISFNFTTEAKLKDLLDIFEFYKINTIVDSEIDLEKPIIINKYNGNLKQLLKAISNNTNLTVKQKDGFLYIQELSTYKIKVIQDKEILQAVKEELEKMEIKELIISETAGLFSFKSDYKTFKKIQDIVFDINNNTSLINLDLSIINIEMNESNGNGFDWSTLNIAANLETNDLIEKGISLANQKLGIKTDNINMSLVMNILNTYGQSEILQSTSIKTLSGKQASFKTIETTPFIDKIETTANGEYAQTGFTTKETTTGLDIKILPYFDSNSKMVNTKIEVVKSNLKGFLNVSNEDSEIKQPQIEEQNFNSVIRLKTGETSVIGGLIYYEQRKDGNNLISEFTQSNKQSLKKNALFIIIKPSVKSYIYK